MKIFVFWLLLGGLILRLFAWQLLPSVLADDAVFYHQIALNLSKTGRFFGNEGLTNGVVNLVRACMI